MNKYLASILENVYLLGEYEQLRILMMLLEKQGAPEPEEFAMYLSVPKWLSANPDITRELKDVLSQFPHLSIYDIPNLYPKDKRLTIKIINEIRQKLGMDTQMLN